MDQNTDAWSNDGSETPPNNWKPNEPIDKQVVFRLDSNPSSKVVGIECHISHYLDGSLLQDLSFSDDWCLILPSPEFEIASLTRHISCNNLKIERDLNNDRISIDNFIQLSGSKNSDDLGFPRLFNTAIKLPGSAIFANATAVTLQQGVSKSFQLLCCFYSYFILVLVFLLNASKVGSKFMISYKVLNSYLYFPISNRTW